MKVLLVMEGEYPSMGWACADELRRLGHEVRVVDNKRNHLPGRPRSVWEYGRTARRLRLSRLNDTIVNRTLRREAVEFDPELILLSKCENLYTSTIQFLRDRTTAVLFNWNLDNPFFPTNSSIAHLRSMPILHAYGVFGQQFGPVVESLGCPRVEFLPCYFHPVIHDPSVVLDREDKLRYTCDVVFAGSWSREREAMLESVADFDLFIWGNSWDSLPQGSPLRDRWRGGTAHGEEYVKMLAGAKCVLNVFNLQGRGANNLRTFEATGLGKLLVTEYSQEQSELLFREDEIVAFRSTGELRAKLEHCLSHPTESQRIASKGQARTLREHTLRHRLERILEVTEEIRGAAPVGSPESPLTRTVP